MGTRIKDAPLVGAIKGSDKLPISNNSDQPQSVSVDQLKGYCADEVNEYNISALNGGATYAGLQEAINALKAYLGDKPERIGTKCTFVKAISNKAETWVFQGGSFLATSNWVNELMIYKSIYLGVSGVSYNSETDTYRYKDIILTPKDMAISYAIGVISPQDIGAATFVLSKAKVFFIQNLRQFGAFEIDFIETFRYCYYVQKIYLSEYPEYVTIASQERLILTFDSCYALTDVIGVIDVNRASNTLNAFKDCKELVNIQLKNLNVGVSFAWSPNLSVADDNKSTLAFAIKNRSSSNTFTITLHAEAFARVPESLKQKAQAQKIIIQSA